MDWIELVERSYHLEGSLHDWLAGLVEASGEALEGGVGYYGHVFAVRGPKLAVQEVAAFGAMAGTEEAIRVGTEVAPVDAVRVMFDAGYVAGSARELLEPHGLGELFVQVVQAGTGGMARDMVGIVANDYEGWGVALAGARAERGHVSAADLRRWTQATSHVGSGLRLRRKLEADPESEPEAILDASGEPVHLTARTESARERLRAAARAIDTARTRRGRSDPDESLSIWQGLVEGRWSLVDRFESDGRRFVVAHQNAIDVRDPRGLTPTELLVAELLGKGRSVKEIAYQLGVTPSAITNAAQRARKKLGLSSTPELVELFAPGGIRARLERFEVGEERLAVSSTEPLEEALAPLSDAEREIAVHLLRGRTNRSIAELRETSERTVANQVASIFRKLDVGSRCELAARVSE